MKGASNSRSSTVSRKLAITFSSISLRARYKFIEATLGGDAQYCWFLAECYALAGDAASAIRWLQRAVSLGFINYPLLAERDPFLASLRDEPAFGSLIADVHRRWEGFTV